MNLTFGILFLAVAFGASCADYLKKIPASLFHLRKATEGVCSFANPEWFKKLNFSGENRQALTDKLDFLQPTEAVDAGGDADKISLAIDNLLAKNDKNLFKRASEMSQLVAEVANHAERTLLTQLALQLEKLSGPLLNVHRLRAFLHENFLAVDKEISYKSVVVDIHDTLMILFWEGEMCWLEFPSHVTKCDASSLSELANTNTTMSGIKEPFEKTLSDIAASSQDGDISNLVKYLQDNINGELLYLIMGYLELIAKCIILYNQDESKGAPMMESIGDNYEIIMGKLMENKNLPPFVKYRVTMIGRGLGNSDFNAVSNLPWYRDNGMVLLSAVLSCFFITSLTFIMYHVTKK
jgi:hypothetical protein